MTIQTDRAGNKLTRRRFLQAAGGATFMVATSTAGNRVVAQVATPEATPAASPSVTLPPTLQESPALAELVSSGAIPAVADRIGLEPMIVTPTESVGVYGGTWRSGLVGGQDTAWLDRTVGYENLLRWDPGWNEPLPNIAIAYEASADATQYTFTLRKGMKWSDGQPFTSADVEFRVNSISLNTELNPGGQGKFSYSIEVHDEQTFTLTFDRANGLFLKNLCTVAEREWTRYPKHYLSQFHKDLNTTNLDQLVSEAGVADWVELFRTKGGIIPGTPYNALWSNAELPVNSAWKIVEPYGDGTRVTFDRNPYYWKIDPSGNQLPYIDNVAFDVVEEAEVLLLKATAGEIDFHMRHFNTNLNKPVLADSQESGQYHFVDSTPASMNTVSIALNLTHKNEAMRTLFQNHDFRAGLSHAINRQEIIDTVFVSQGEAWQLAPRSDTPYYNETLAKQYTEYNLDTANQLLDSVLPNKDGSGWRTMPDGSALNFVIEVASGLDTAQADSMNLVVGYWNAVGVNCQLKPEDRALMYTRKGANDCDCVIWGGDGGGRDAIQEARWYFPFNNESNFAPAWYVWYAKPANPECEPMEPPAEAQQQMELYAQIEGTAVAEEQNALFSQILDIAQQQFWAMGISLPAQGYGICKNNFKNVPALMPNAYLYPNPAPTNPEQYYIEQ